MTDELRERIRAQYGEGLPVSGAHRVGLDLGADGAVRAVVGVDEAEADARLEKQIVADADKQLRALGFVVVNFSQPRATKQTAGIPDRLFLHTGRAIAFWWEAKTPTGRQSAAQREFQEWCEATHLAYVLGTDRQLFDWLVARYPLRWDESGHLTWSDR